MQDFDWGTLGAFLGVVSVVVAVSTKYVTLFVSKQMNDLEKRLKDDYMPREVLTQRLETIERRLGQVENQ